MSEKRGRLDVLLDVGLLMQPSNAPRVAELEPGGRLGKYRVERLLGSGSMGAVWDARDLELDRHVALKVVHAEHAAVSVVRSRLLREARAMARLRHPNVITVFDAETIDGRDVIAMELSEGETLASWLARDHRKDEIVAMLVAAGRGLAAAHEAGIVHRDFKPHNVLVDGRRAVVTDFGLARGIEELVPAGAAVPASVDVATTLHDRPHPPVERDAHKTLGALDLSLTITGAVLGTPAYMAPEQLSGFAADERADQFAFCTTFWEAIATQRPFLGDSVPEIGAAIAAGKPSASERVPRRLRALLLRGLAIDPSKRWPSMTALLDAIDRIWRRPRRVAVAAAALTVLSIAGWIGYRAFTRSDIPTWTPHIVDLPAFEENSDGAAISPDGTRIAFDSDRDQPKMPRLYVAALDGTGEVRAITPPGQFFAAARWTRDGKALLAMRYQNGGYRIVRIPLDGGPIVDLGRGIEADDCGDALAVVDFDEAEGRLQLQRGDGTREVLLRSTTEFMLRPRCDPTGRRIALTKSLSGVLETPSGDLVIVDRVGHTTQLSTGHTAANGSWTPDGRSIVFSALAHDESILLFEVSVAGGAARQLTTSNGPHLAADISRDGHTLIFNRDESSRVAVAGGEGALRRLTPRREVLDIAIPTRDGKRIVAERMRPHTVELVVIDTTDGTERVLVSGIRPATGAHMIMGALCLSRDERRVMFASYGRRSQLEAIALAGGTIQTLATLPGDLSDLVDGPDGQHLEVHRVDGTTEWLHLGLDRKLEPERIQVRGLVIPAPSGGWRSIRMNAPITYRFVAPDGTLSPLVLRGESRHPTWLDDHRFAYAAKGAFHIVDVTTGTELATLPGPSDGFNAVLAADGVHWFDIEPFGHVTRHLLVNFTDRPWR